MEKFNFFFSMNLIVQAWPIHENEDEESGAIVDWKLLNYMPRKERCDEIRLSEFELEESERMEIFRENAKYLRNLAKLFDDLADDKRKYIYYADGGMSEVIE